MTDASQYGKGAIRTPDSVTITRFKLAAIPPPVIDWSVPFRVPVTLDQRNQDGSSSCTAQATCYYTEALSRVENNEPDNHSARFIYSQTSLGLNQGSYIWKAMSIPLNIGAAQRESVPDLDSSEAIMINPSDNANGFIQAKTDKYATFPHGPIDQMAQIIKDYHGFVTGFNGHDGMFAADGTVVDWSRNDWGHAVYVCGYEMHNGKKCLVFKNSWGSAWGTDGFGYFPEEFVTSGMMFDAYVYALISDLDINEMFELVKVDGSTEVWLVKDGKRTHIYNAAALTTISTFANVKIITQAQLDAIPDSGLDLASLVRE